MDRRAHSGLRLRRGKLQCSCGLHSTECVACHERGRARSRAAESNGGCSSGVERLTVAQEVAGSKPVTRPTFPSKSGWLQRPELAAFSGVPPGTYLAMRSLPESLRLRARDS